MRIFAVPRWVFGFWTWNFDTWFSSSSPRHSIVDTFFFFFFSPRMAGRMFSLILKLGKSAPKCFFFFCVHLCVSWWARAQSRVKSSISNSQNWAGHSDISKIMASWPAQLVGVIQSNLTPCFHASAHWDSFQQSSSALVDHSSLFGHSFDHVHNLVFHIHFNT